MRWPYVVGGLFMVGGAMLVGMNALAGGHLLDWRRVPKLYSIPSESMLPTLEIGDHVMPRRAEPQDLRPGTVVLFTTGGDVWVQRIAAVAGDTIQMRDGQVILNGKPVPLRNEGSYVIPPGDHPLLAGDPESGMRFSEQFPGEAHPHYVLDTQEGRFDDTAVFTVPAGHLFLLGDNRDNSADSRLPQRFDGSSSLVLVSDIVGVVDFIFSSRRHGFGRPIDSARTAQ